MLETENSETREHGFWCAQVRSGLKGSNLISPGYVRTQHQLFLLDDSQDTRGADQSVDGINLKVST